MNHPALHGVPPLHLTPSFFPCCYSFISSIPLLLAVNVSYFLSLFPFFFQILQDHIESNLTLAVSCSRCHTNPHTYTATPLSYLCVMVMHVCVLWGGWGMYVSFFAHTSDMSLYDMHWHICMDLLWCTCSITLSLENETPCLDETCINKGLNK